MYTAMFPQLVAGPIVRYSTIQDQILHRRESLRDFAAGARLFCVGLAKKVLLANTVAILAHQYAGRGRPRYRGDRRLGRTCGLHLPDILRLLGLFGHGHRPGKDVRLQVPPQLQLPLYLKKRHRVLATFAHIALLVLPRLRLHPPRGKSGTPPRWAFNPAVVWLLTEFRHGAAWNYILWRLYYLALLLLEKLLVGQWLHRLPSPIQWAYTALAFMGGWLLFWIEDLSVMGSYLLALVGAFGATGSSTFWELGAWSFIPVLLMCALASTPIIPWLRATVVISFIGGDEG